MNTRALVIVIITIFFVTACSSAFDINKDDVMAIEISEFKHFGSANTEKLITFNDMDSIEVFVDAINSSKRIKGSVDMPDGNYDIKVLFNETNPKVFHLWLREESGLGTIVNVDETETAYNLSIRSVKKLKNKILISQSAK